MMASCVDLDFSLYGEEGGEMVEEVENFKYLGQTLDQTDDDWPVVGKKITHKSRGRTDKKLTSTLVIWTF